MYLHSTIRRNGFVDEEKEEQFDRYPSKLHTLPKIIIISCQLNVQTDLD